MNTNKRLNSLLTRMLSNDSNASNETSPVSNEINSTKRNLFGIRLNHDQLKQDLTEMWKEQCEMQKCRWNFDFEKMKPVKQNHNDTLTESSPVTKRFEWHRVNINYQPNIVDQKELQMSAFAKDELKYLNKRQNNSLFDDDNEDDEGYDYESDEETEEEDDLALAIPQFYKYQRRMKINDEQNRVKYMKLNPISLVKQTPAKRLDKNSLVAATPLKRNKLTNSTQKKSSPTLLFDSVSSFKPIFRIKTISPVSFKEEETKKVVTRSSAKKTTKSSSNDLIKPTAIKQKSSTATTTTKTKTKKAVIKNNKITKSNALKSQQTPLKLNPSVEKLIITFSENRKDTLRSATSSHSNSTDCESINKINVSESSAFNSVSTIQPQSHPNAIKVENLKQQSLLDLFKQRKRRNSTSNSTSSNVSQLIKDKVSQSATKSSHYLRSHTNY